MKFFEKSLGKLHRSLKASEQEIKKLEQQNNLPPVGKKSRLRQRLTAVAGLFILLLALSGIVFGSLFVYHVKLHKEEETYQAQIRYYTDFIAPVVLFDTGEFVDPDHANNFSLLIPAFFKAQETVYAGSEEREAITHTDVASRYIIRSEAVEEAAQALFGRTVLCQSFTLDGLRFDYVENEKYFLSPITLRIGMYTPNIVDMKPTDSGVELTVEYVEATAQQNYKVGKTMKITLEGEYQKEHITAVTAADPS